MAFDSNLIINVDDSQKAGIDRSGNFMAKNILSGARTMHSAMNAKVGAVAGWTVRAADDKALSTLGALLQSSSTLIIPISGLKIGDTITEFSVLGQIESGGGTVTLDADLRKLTSAEAGHADASVGTITQVSVTADGLLNATTAGKTGLTEVVGANETFYVKITGITGAASTDIEIQGVEVVTNWQPV